MQVSSDQLVFLLGRKQVEVEMLTAENEQLRQRVQTLEVAAEVRKGSDEEGD